MKRSQEVNTLQHGGTLKRMWTHMRRLGHVTAAARKLSETCGKSMTDVGARPSLGAPTGRIEKAVNQPKHGSL